MGELVLLGIRVLHVADRPWNALQEGGDAFVAFATHSADPFHRRPFTDRVLPVRADLRQIVGEDEGRTGAIGAVDGRDGLVGELEPRVQIGDRRVIPLLDLAEVDVCEHRTGQLHVAGLDAGDIHHRNHAADDGGELDQPVPGELFRLERHVARSEVHGLGGDLFETCPGPDGLIVHLGTGGLVVGFRPLRIQRRRKGRARAHDLRCNGGCGQQYSECCDGGTARDNGRETEQGHDEPPVGKVFKPNRASLQCRDK